MLHSFNRVEDDVLLQHVVVAERLLPRLKDMKPIRRQCAQKVFAKWSEVRAIAEAPGRDGDELSARGEKLNRCCKETRIDVACLDAHLPEKLPSLGATVNLVIWGIENCAGERGRSLRRKQVAVQHVHRCREEIFLVK